MELFDNTQESADASVPLVRGVFNGETIISDDGQMRISDVYKHSLRPMSRVRPKPLIMAPTSMLRQTTLSNTTGQTGERILIEGYPHEGQVGTLELTLYSYPRTAVGVPGSYPVLDWITPARNDIKDLKVNVGESLAEYRQTVKMFGGTGRAVRKAWHTYRHLRRGNLKKAMCDVAAADIIYGFGIRPLLGVMYDSYQRLVHELYRPIYKKVYVHRSGFRLGVTFPSDRVEHWVVRNNVKANIYMEFKPYNPQFTLGNTAELAWELLPFSFLFDYMIPFGNYLSSLDALESVTNLTGTVTFRDTYSIKSRKLNPASGYTFVGNGSAKSQFQSHKRDVVSGIPLPPFPRWKPSASWHKLRHAVALLVSAQPTCGGRRRPIPAYTE